MREGEGKEKKREEERRTHLDHKRSRGIHNSRRIFGAGIFL
jgi:hypothetical protein